MFPVLRDESCRVKNPSQTSGVGVGQVEVTVFLYFGVTLVFLDIVKNRGRRGEGEVTGGVYLDEVG